MFQAYVAVGFRKHLDLVEANPYVMEVNNNNFYLKEIDKENADGLVYYLLDELKPEEIYLFKDAITVVGVNAIIRQRKHLLKK